MLKKSRFWLVISSFGLIAAVARGSVSVNESGNTITVKTSRAKYEFDKSGGGFAHIYDNDKNDWIGTDHGKDYQGIPNLVLSGDLFHPYRNNCTSEVTSTNSSKAVITSRSKTKEWELYWEFFDTYAKMTLVKKGEKKYWFLYEGEPGGRIIDDHTFWMSSAHSKSGLSGSEKDLPAPEWAAFGNDKINRSLFLLHYEDDDKIDGNWSNGCCGGMTVFGFGRKGTGSKLTEAPQHFAIGFIESKDYNTVKQTVEALAEGETAISSSPGNIHGARGAALEKTKTNRLFSMSQDQSILEISITQAGIHTINLVSCRGRLVQRLEGRGEKTYAIRRENLETGFYLLSATINGVRCESKIVIR